MDNKAISWYILFSISKRGNTSTEKLNIVNWEFLEMCTICDKVLILMFVNSFIGTPYKLYIYFYVLMLLRKKTKFLATASGRAAWIM